MLYYAAITTPKGEYLQGIYTPEEYHRATFSPDTVTRYFSNLKPRDKSEARELVIDILNADTETNNNDGEGLSWGEWAILGGAFEKWAHRFGLVREFRENGII